MAPRSAKRGAAKKPSARAKKFKPITSDPSLAPSSRMSEEEALQDTEVFPNVGDKVSEVEAYFDSATEDDVAREENTVSIEEFGSTSVAAVEVLESEEVEGTGTESDADKSTPNEPAGLKLENEETFKEDSLAASSVEEKIAEDIDSSMFNETATPKEPVSHLCKELVTEKMAHESELLSVSPFEDTFSIGAGDKMSVDKGLKQNFQEGVGKDDKKAVPGINENVADCVKGIYANHDSTNDVNEANEENEDSDQEFYMHAALMEGKERKESEIFIGGLDKGAVEDDLVKVFKAFGDLQSVRIVKHPTTKKSKGFAFIGFSSNDNTMKALTELKDGIEVNGKRVRVQVSYDNATLYLGNISKGWTRDNVIETLKSFGVERMESMILPEDLKIEGKIKGFAFLEFSSNSDAMLAYQQLRRPDVFFGCDRTARVVFMRAPLHPTQELLVQIKTVCIEDIPISWDVEKVQEICKEYGRIEKVLLSRNFCSSKRKDFGFVKFSSHESAVASVEGINNAQLGEGDTNIIASLCKSLNKGQLTNQDDRGVSMIKKDGEANHEVGRKKKKKKAKSKGVKLEEDIQLKLKNVIENIPSESKAKGSNARPGSQIVKSVKRKKSGGNATEATALRGPSKKTKMHHIQNNDKNGKVHDQHSHRARKRKSSFSKNPVINIGSHLSAYPPRRRRPTNSEYNVNTAVAEPMFSHSDLEPHAGYLPAVKRASTTFQHDRRRSGSYNSEQMRIYGFSGAIQRVQTSYPDYTGYADPQPAGYRYPRIGGAYAPRGPYY